MTTRSLTVVDLFAGAGGMSLGFRLAGCKVLAAVEYAPDSVKTYRHNHARLRECPTVFENDIWEEGLECRVLSALTSQGIMAGELDVLTAGLPCETFSVAQRRRRSPNDKRSHLFLRVLDFVQTLQPRAVLIENVPALKRAWNGIVFDRIRDLFRELGYGFTHNVLNAADFGVPQKRNRLFMLAIRGRQDAEMPSLEPKRVDHQITVSEALADLSPLPPLSGALESKTYPTAPALGSYGHLMRVELSRAVGLEPSETVANHYAQNHRERMVLRFHLIPAGKDLKHFIRENGHWLSDQERLVGYTRHRRPSADEPSYTVTAHAADELLHPTMDRIVTPREAARLQSFPDWYEFLGPRSGHHGHATVQDWYEQIGDAVPPLLAKALAEYLRDRI